MLLVFPSQKGFVWVFKGCAPVGRSSGSLPPIQPRILEDPPILPTDSAIEPDFKVAGKLDGLCRCGWEAIETVGKQLMREAVTETGGECPFQLLILDTAEVDSPTRRSRCSVAPPTMRTRLTPTIAFAPRPD
jgi:hypothetical protein